ncbi:MAG: gamma-glutamyltransferase [Defluviicoccus sp.]
MHTAPDTPRPLAGLQKPLAGRWRRCASVLLLLTTACALDNGRQATPPQPAAHAATGARQMVVAAHPLAAEAGLAMLRAGGSVLDAAIAAQMMLTLVEPQSSGIGGGGFLLHFERASGRIDAYDGRETAPSGAHEAMFLAPDGQPRSFGEASGGGLAVSVPGLLRMLERAHLDHGRLPWRALFQPAIAEARSGFTVSPRLARAIAGARGPNLNAAGRALFYHPDETPLTAGERLKNPALAETLAAVADKGADALYTGKIADAVVAAVREAANPGSLSEADLAGYTAIRRDAICAAYRGRRVCGMPPPSSGGIATLQILGLLEPFDFPATAPMSADAVHWFIEASRLAFADRDLYVADPDATAVPTAGLLDRSYLAARSRLIGTRAMPQAAPGLPPDPSRTEEDAAAAPSEHGTSTTHISVVDSVGNAVAMTSSIEASFGARIVAAGFVLNNQLTDFAFVPEVAGRRVKNRPGAGKRPRSSMAPTLVFDEGGRLMLVLGSPGGARIIAYVAQTLIGVLDWGLNIEDAIDLPRVVNRNGPTELEPAAATDSLRQALEQRGHSVQIRELASGLHGIQRNGAVLLGGADPRREGAVRAD